MSKIYEALELAQQERKGLQVFPAVPKHELPASGKSKKLEVEDEMVHLYQAINSQIPDSPKKVIQFIGTRNGEGTSTIIREFARVSTSFFDISVLLLDANHQSCHTSFFGIRPERGLADVIKDRTPIKDVIHQVGKSSLFMGRISLNGDYITSLFDSPQVEGIFEELKQEFDLILIDSPPATVSSDGLVISRRMDGIILIVESEGTRWQVAHDVKERITKNGGNILGVILNKRRYYIPHCIYKRL